MIFNKEVTKKRQGKKAGVIFRGMPDTGNEARYQGNINKNGQILIESLGLNHKGMSVVFSDEHSIIGFKPLTKSKGVKFAFSATQLFKNLNLIVGKSYNLEIIGDYATIDSDEHN